MTMWMKIDSALSGDQLMLEPCEAFGFNLGDWTDTNPLEGSPSQMLTFEIKDDVTELVLVADEDSKTKIKLPLATHVFNVLKEQGVPDIRLDFHVMQPMKVADADVLFRFTLLVQQPTTGFVPKELGDEQLRAEFIKRAAIGACFIGKFDKLPSENAELTWEIQKDLVPPAAFKPTKPKMWFANRMKLEKSYYYLLK